MGSRLHKLNSLLTFMFSTFMSTLSTLMSSDVSPLMSTLIIGVYEHGSYYFPGWCASHKMPVEEAQQ